MKALLRLFGHHNDDTDAVMDFVPVQEPVSHAAKLKKARARHGKEFHCNTVKARETAPTHDLLQITNAGKKAKPDTVRAIGRKA